MTDKNEYNEIIATLDRIIVMQDKMIEKISNMDGKMKMITEEINNISSEKLNGDAVTSMREKWDTTGPR
jgi:predicted transcriptional regulator